jgi:hypothetical protein
MSFVKSNADALDKGPSLMCSAHGCPLRWAVRVESPLCSYHAWEEPIKWPAITDELCRIGPWLRAKSPESPTVADMKTRVRSGFRFSSLDQPRKQA